MLICACILCPSEVSWWIAYTINLFYQEIAIFVGPWNEELYSLPLWVLIACKLDPCDVIILPLSPMYNYNTWLSIISADDYFNTDRLSFQPMIILILYLIFNCTSRTHTHMLPDFCTVIYFNMGNIQENISLGMKSVFYFQGYHHILLIVIFRQLLCSDLKNIKTWIDFHGIAYG